MLGLSLRRQKPERYNSGWDQSEDDVLQSPLISTVCSSNDYLHTGYVPFHINELNPVFFLFISFL